MKADEYCLTYKFRLYPNDAQKQMIARTFGAVRYVYNLFLNYRQNLHECQDKWATLYDTCNLLTLIKREEPDRAWLKEIDTNALRGALKCLDFAYKKFFAKQCGYPRFKSRRHHRQSYTTDSTAVRVYGDKIWLPKIGRVKFVQSREMIVGRIVKATVMHTSSDKYFVFVVVKGSIEEVLRRNAGGTIGIDVGIKSFCVDDKGAVIDHPRPLAKLSKKLTTAHRQLDRKVRGSNNYNKQRIKLARLYERITNIRIDFIHKLTTRLCRENQTVAVESLDVMSMLKNHKLAKAISDVAWGRFFYQLSYKAIIYGCTVLKVPTRYPSSQTCSECGFKNPIVKNLKIRKWDCPRCGAHHDRDRNAAINILNKALEMRG